ncbi:MAG: hypothetical protein J6S05_03280 [Bacteroidaceae bacterium]|nr:hypothetical protein [Bacteroidaceae bacterium]
MKKLLLLFAVLLTTVGAWAQVNYGKRTWTFPATDHEAVSEVPAEIFTDFATQYSETELTNEKVGVFVTDVRVATEGDVTAAFVHNGGDVRMDIGGVDLVNANGEVVYSDYHFGFAGTNSESNVYTLTGVAVGDYTMRAFIPAQKEDITPATTKDSRGVLTITGAWMYPNEGVYYNIKNVRSNKYVTFKGEGKQFTQESANNGAGSYWYFVEASLDDVKKWKNPWLEDGAIPEGVKPYWVYSAACEKAVENVSNGYMSTPDMSEQWPAKIYYIGVHTAKGTTGLIFRPCHEDGSSWNDAGGSGTALGHYGSNDPGSLWSIELANVADNDLKAMATTAKNEAIAATNVYKTAYYIYAKPSVVDAAVAEIEGADVGTVAKALTFVIKGTGTAIVNEIAESATVLTPKAGDRFMIKGNVQQNDYLIAATTGNVKTTNGIGANDINALDLVWTLKTADVEGKFNLYNERLGVYVAPLTTNRNGTMGYVTDVANAGVYSVELKGANVVFHADGQDGYGYIHHPRWGSKELTRWEANDDNSQWQLVEAPLELTTDINAPICYAIKSGRDGNYYFTLENNKIKLINNQDIVGNDKAKWFFMLDENKNLKIYPYADKNNTMGYITVADGNTKLTNDHNAQGYVADTYTLYYNPNLAAKNNGKCFAFRPTEGNTFVSNHGGTGNYMGFYNENDDKGTRLGFENINKEVLVSKIETWESYLDNEGDKVCQYVIEDNVKDEVKSVLVNAERVAYSHASNNSNYAAELTVLNAIAFPSINVPQVGSFYRLKNGASGWYATSDLRTGEAQHNDKLYMLEDGTQANTIWYVGANNALLSYTKGQYLADMSSDWSFEAVGSNGNTTTFVQGATIGKIQIKPSSGRSLYGDKVRVDAAPEGNNSGNYEWTIEEVTTLPVTITAAKYATFYCPVAVTLSDGLTAYYVSKAGNGYATLTDIKGNVVPANTGVLLYADVEEPTTYNLTIGGNDTEVTSLLTGTVASTYVEEESYVLSAPDGVESVGLYKAKKNFTVAANGTGTKVAEGATGTHFLNNGFKAYLPKPEGTPDAARFFVFDFGGNETGIEGVEGENGNVKTEIYDLAGRRVQNAQKGVFIVNGKVVIK